MASCHSAVALPPSFDLRVSASRAVKNFEMRLVLQRPERMRKMLQLSLLFEKLACELTYADHKHYLQDFVPKAHPIT